MTLARGDAVQVSDRRHDGHCRTPGYLKGKRGRVSRVHATFRNPEARAYGADGLPRRRLYLVEFAASDVWPSAKENGDRVFADLFEHWLEPAS
jgi:nitrile hydratase